jgi:LPS-assembly protein
MYRNLLALPCAFALALTASSAGAQQTISGYNTVGNTQERIGENHWRLAGGVELEQGNTKLYADAVEIFADEDRAIATGNVVLAQGNNRIAADRADFNTRTRLGTFYNAQGIANVQPQRQTAAPGAFVPPPIAGQETDVYFFGETIEKIGPKKYKITNGGFSTCVQPTPRWNLSADTVVLNIDHYTLLRQAVLTVKGVPMLYLPILYYPTKEGDRATGFLLPTYGASTIRGQSIHNAFFWAIDRSQDATIVHDWFSKAGQGVGSEYRYNLGGGSDGDLRAYMLDQGESVYASNGTSSTLPASRSYDIRGGVNQLLPGNLRARGRVDYFSSIQTMQTFNTNVYDASRSQRSYGGNVVGAWRTYSLNGTYDRSEYFSGTLSSVVAGSTPRIAVTRNERPLTPGSPVYVSASTEYAHLARQSRAATLVVDSSLSRFDFSPQIRYPFKKWQWFTVNSALGWRDTFYTRSLDPQTRQLEDGSLNRRYFTFQAHAVGPLFSRVWDTPDNGYAEKFKHSIEPFMTVRRTSSIDNFDRIVQTDGIDAVVGNTTSYTYGLNSRFYAKRRGGRLGQVQDVISAELTQSYYSDERASRYDRQYSTSSNDAPPSHFSPILLGVRAAPSVNINATLRAEFDSRYYELRTLSATGAYNLTDRLQTTIGWSQRFFIEDLAGFNDPRYLNHYLNVTSNAHTRDNRLGAIYSFNYDVLNKAMLQQRISAFYNAQCCGIAFEYQTFNFGGGFAPVPADRRFFLSFSLAGLGNFSPFNGAMSEVPR